VRSEGACAYFIGDLLHTTPQLAHPEWSPFFDWAGGGTGAVSPLVRRSVLARAADEGATLLSPHLPFPGAGRVERAADGFRLAPLDDENAYHAPKS
jgi:hypothetical protein